MNKNYILKRKKYDNIKNKIIFIKGKIKLFIIIIIIISLITYSFNSDICIDEIKDSYITLKIGSGGDKFCNRNTPSEIYINYNKISNNNCYYEFTESENFVILVWKYDLSSCQYYVSSCPGFCPKSETM